MADEHQQAARRASVALLTASLHDRSICDTLVEEWALSPDLEPLRLAVGDTLLRTGLACIADAVEHVLPGSRSSRGWSGRGAELFADILHGAFCRVPAPLGPALADFDDDDASGDVVAGDLARDFPTAVIARLQGVPDSSFRALLIEAHYLGYGARAEDRYRWLQSTVTVTLCELLEVSERLGLDPANELARWGLMAA
jgi:hypothetical protein